MSSENSAYSPESFNARNFDLSMSFKEQMAKSSFQATIPSYLNGVGYCHSGRSRPHPPFKCKLGDCYSDAYCEIRNSDVGTTGQGHILPDSLHSICRFKGAGHPGNNRIKRSLGLLGIDNV